jgi:cysteine desulfurase
MKKFLDFTSNKLALCGYEDPLFVPLAPQSRFDDRVKKIIDKINFGFKSEKNPFVYFFASPFEASLFLFWHLILEEAPQSGKNQLLFEAVSSKSVLEFAKALKNFSMISTLVSPTKDGTVSLEFLESKLGPKSLCFSHRLTHPVLGTTSLDFPKISRLLKEKGVYYHVDITKALGEAFFDLETIEADFITFDMASIAAPLKGSVLFSKKPLCEFFQKSMTPDMSYLETFMHSLENLSENASNQMLKKITLKMQFVHSLKEKINTVHFVLPENAESLSHKLICLPQVNSDALNYFLMSKKAMVELGGGSELPLAMLLEMCFVPHNIAHSSFSVCFEDSMSSSDIESLNDIIAESYASLLKGAL